MGHLRGFGDTEATIPPLRLRRSLQIRASLRHAGAPVCNSRIIPIKVLTVAADFPHDFLDQLSLYSGGAPEVAGLSCIVLFSISRRATMFSIVVTIRARTTLS